MRSGHRTFLICCVVIGAAPKLSDAFPESETAPLDLKTPVRITGRVIDDEGGQPLGGAQVFILLPAADGGRTYNAPLPLERTKADERGEFAFEASRSGRHVVWANHNALTSRHKLITGKVVSVSADATPDAAELRLTRGGNVHVMVTDKTHGRPVAGATVRYFFSELGDFKTDQNGEVNVAPLPWERLQFEILADGYAKQMHWVDLLSGNDAELAVSLEPGGAVEGIVQDAHGKPLTGARVNANLVGKPGLFWAAPAADAAGKYRIDNVPFNESIQLYVSKDGYLRAQHQLATSEAVIHFDITMTPRPHGGSLKGTVVDRDGRPIPGAQVANHGNDSRDERIAKSDDTGNFLLDDLFRGFSGCQITVTAKGFAPAVLDVEPGPADSPIEIKVVLQPGHRVVGKVVDEEGQPVAGVWVGWNQIRNRLGDSTHTDDTGHFDLDSLPENCLVSFSKEGYTRLSDQQLPLDGEGKLNVVLSPQGVVRGKVVDARSGEPLKSFRVRVSFSPRRSPGDPRAGIPSELVEPGLAFRPGDGAFGIKGLSLRLPLQVTVEAEGYEPCVNERIECRAPNEARPVEFRMLREDPAKLVAYRGRLVDAQGHPIAGAQMRLIALAGSANNPKLPPLTWMMIQQNRAAQRSDVRRFVQAATGKDGAFHFERIPRDIETELVWWGSGITPGRRKELEKLSDAERGELEIVLAPPARLVGRVDRQFFPDVKMVVVHSIGGVIDYISLPLAPAEEKFAAADLPAGKYTIALMAPVKQAAAPAPRFGVVIGTPQRAIERRELELAPGQEVEVVFDAAEQKGDTKKPE